MNKGLIAIVGIAAVVGVIAVVMSGNKGEEPPAPAEGAAAPRVETAAKGTTGVKPLAKLPVVDPSKMPDASKDLEEVVVDKQYMIDNDSSNADVKERISGFGDATAEGGWLNGDHKWSKMDADTRSKTIDFVAREMGLDEQTTERFRRKTQGCYDNLASADQRLESNAINAEQHATEVSMTGLKCNDSMAGMLGKGNFQTFNELTQK